MNGTWKEDGNAAVITWDTGWTTKITKEGNQYKKPPVHPGLSGVQIFENHRYQSIGVAYAALRPCKDFLGAQSSGNIVEAAEGSIAVWCGGSRAGRPGGASGRARRP